MKIKRILIKTPDNNTTALWTSAQENHPNVVQILLENKANIDDFNEGGRDSTHHGQLTKTMKILFRILIEHKASINPDPDTVLALNPLMAAAQHGNLNLLKILLEHKAIVDLPNTRKETALFKAAQEGREDILETLVEYKAHFDDVITEECLTPLIIAAHAGQENVVKKLINYKVDVNLGDKQKENSFDHGS